MQAADYWSRIRRHQEAGDLARYGYFPGVPLQATPPLVFLKPEMEVVRIGLAESWRRGLRVMMRQ